MKKIVILSLMCFGIFACDQKNRNSKKVDKFYTDKGDFDLSRFPLIKPYEISTAIPMGSWIISSVDTSEVLGTIPGTKYVNVSDSAIFAYGRNTVVNDQSAKEGWFIIIPRRHVFLGFKTQKEYLNYLSSMGVHDEKMYSVDEIFHYFDIKDTLDWQNFNREYSKK